MMELGPLVPGVELPWVVRPLSDQAQNLSSLRAWLAERRDELEALLLRHGALLFRGFRFTGEADFEGLACLFVPELLNYVEGDSPRKHVSGKVYTSTEYPPPFTIALHNELSYSHRWPSKLFFHCQTAARQGGETPLADCRQILQRMDPGIRERFAQRGVMYVQNLHGGTGMGKSWQQTFETQDRAVVEEYCRRSQIEFRWKPDGGLWTAKVRQGIARHPRTGEEVWFNQAEHWHVLSMNPATRQALSKLMPEKDFPRQAYYGDGGPIDPVDLEKIQQVLKTHEVAFPWQEGDVLMIDNMLVMHGRRPFQGPRRVLVAMG